MITCKKELRPTRETRRTTGTRSRRVLGLGLSAALLLACSSGSSNPPAPTNEQTVEQASTGPDGLFDNPGPALFSIPSSYPGISAWEFHGQPNRGFAVLGTNNAGVQAEVTLVPDSTGDLAGLGFALGAALANADPKAVINALLADLHTSVANNGTTTGMATRILGGSGLVSDGGLLSDGGSLVSSCQSYMDNNFNKYIGPGALLTAGITLLAAATCPETLGLGCAVGALVLSGTAAAGAHDIVLSSSPCASM
jgi:hypothetical protein